MCGPGTPPEEPITTSQLLRPLILQVTQLLKLKSPAQDYPSIPLLGDSEDDWFASLGAALAPLENAFIIIDSAVLKSGQQSGDDVCRPWMTNLLRICDSHRSKFNKDGYLPQVGVKVALAVCGYQPGQAELPEPQQKDRWLYVDITQAPPIPSTGDYLRIKTRAVTGRVAAEQQ